MPGGPSLQFGGGRETIRVVFKDKQEEKSNVCSPPYNKNYFGWLPRRFWGMANSMKYFSESLRVGWPKGRKCCFCVGKIKRIRFLNSSTHTLDYGRDPPGTLCHCTHSTFWTAQLCYLLLGRLTKRFICQEGWNYGSSLSLVLFMECTSTLLPNPAWP